MKGSELIGKRFGRLTVIDRADGDVAIAKDFDVRPGAIWFIRTGKHWSFAA